MAAVLLPQTTLVEATSEDTAIGLAYTAKVKGYDVLVVLSGSVSDERRSLLEGLGATLLLTSVSTGNRVGTSMLACCLGDD